MKIPSWIVGLFNKFVRVFKSFLAIALPVGKQVIIAALKDIAIAAVSKLENTDLSNEEKRNQAFKDIGAEAKAKGIVAGSNLINLIIELALQYIREKASA